MLFTYKRKASRTNSIYMFPRLKSNTKEIKELLAPTLEIILTIKILIVIFQYINKKKMGFAKTEMFTNLQNEIAIELFYVFFQIQF